jgi:hypothetical protein
MKDRNKKTESPAEEGTNEAQALVAKTPMAPASELTETEPVEAMAGDAAASDGEPVASIAHHERSAIFDGDHPVTGGRYMRHADGTLTRFEEDA